MVLFCYWASSGIFGWWGFFICGNHVATHGAVRAWQHLKINQLQSEICKHLIICSQDMAEGNVTRSVVRFSPLYMDDGASVNCTVLHGNTSQSVASNLTVKC